MKPIPYRIRIGVTGHRILESEAEIKKRVIDVLKSELIRLFDADSKILLNKKLHTPVTYSVITALAEGADRLVAETILDYDNESTIEVVLPLTLSDYKETFDNPENLNFSTLFCKARNIKQFRQLNLDNDPSVCSTVVVADKIKNIEQARKEAFKNAGHFIVNHCDVLIAVWDGEKSKGIGGTSDVIDYAISKKRPVIIISTNPSNTIELIVGYGLNCNALKDIEQFNMLNLPQAIQDSYISNMHKKLFQNIEGECLPQSSKETVIEILLPYYVKISYLAKKYQKRYMPSGVLIFSCSAIAVSAVLVGVLYHPILLYSFFTEFLCLLFILSIYLFSKKLRKNWLEYRFLTERMRTACYFAATSTEMSSIIIPPYMGVVNNCNEWMIMIFNEIWGSTPKMTNIKDNQVACFRNYITKHWIGDQKNHHSAKHIRLISLNKRYVFFGWAIYLIAIITSAIHIIHSLYTGIAFSHLLENLLIFLAIALPAIGAAVMGIHKHGEYERLEGRSGNLTKAIEDISIDFKDVSDKIEFNKLMHEFDKLILLENQDWYMLMKLAKLEVCP